MQFSDMNSQFLRDNYLFGIPLEDMYGNKMKEGMLEHYIRAAVEYTQRMLQIVINPVDITDEQHDYYQNDFENWAYIKLHKRPILSVSSISMNFGNQKMFDIPQEWIRVNGIPGDIQLFPVSGSSGSMILTANGSMFAPMLNGLFQFAPQIWSVSYTAGMADIPDDIVEYIMKRASIGILQVWGDLIIGAGIANQTISIDGLSQSIGTTQSPEFTGAGARIKNYQDDMKLLEQHLKDTYVGINLGLI